MTAIPVTVKLDGRLFWKLGTVAEKHGTTIALMLAELGARLVEAPPKPPPAPMLNQYLPFTADDETELVALFALHWTDEEIAGHLGFHRNTIRTHRLHLGLERKRGKRTPEQLQISRQLRVTEKEK